MKWLTRDVVVPSMSKKFTMKIEFYPFKSLVGSDMPKLDGKRERVKFRMEFGDDGGISKFIMNDKDCCADCAESDKTAFVTDA